MESIAVNTPSGQYTISFGPQIWKQMEDFAASFGQVLVVSDTNVAPLYGARLPFPISVLEPGEEQKSLSTISTLINDWSERELDRNSLVIALGGGVIGDLVGFAASIYRRGIAYVQIPTTLLAQVDSAVGGKTGVNTSYGKNLIGTFYQPRAVFIDPEVLRTLPEREVTSGLGEVFKYGIIADPFLFELVQAKVASFYNLEPLVVTDVLRRCLAIKAQIVEEDEKEGGLRKILNHGHTFGHALEQATDYRIFKHGEAVLVGMVLEARLAHALGMLSRSQLTQIEEALFRVKLDYSFTSLPRQQILAALRQDKKNRQGKISFILPQELGEVEEVLLELTEVEQLWKEVVS
ncbi:MAG: 3-dehydroquinate synthase [Firmicutes bacterium]|nr:3-dehydroquinate synthase [Bacillota bacterium]